MEFLLKQRLVGAIVLVALGVIFIPMLLEGPNRNLVPDMEPLPEPEERRAGRPLGSFPAPDGIPLEPESQVVQSDPLPVPTGPAEPPAAETAPDTPPGELKLALPEPAEPAPEPVPEAVKKPAKPAAEPVAAPSKEPGPLGNWVVQVGSFSSEQNALKLRDRIRAAGFATQVEKVVLADKAHYRVRVGPYLKREEAEADLAKITASLQLKGRVLSYP